jgi:transmembrane 9 superfamily protein 2/4
VFGFLFVVLVILVVTCAEITIVMCYFQVKGCSCCSMCDTQH